MVDWDEPKGWRHLTMLWSPSVEQLWEQFNCMDIQKAEPLHRLEMAEEVVTRVAQLLLGR